jgi:hypothetical protein
MKKLLFVAALMLFGALPGAATVTAQEDQANTFTSRLIGANETPAVASNAVGHATFRITDNDTKIHFRISANGLSGITQSHIHLGAKGVKGPVVLFLFQAPAATGSVNGEGWSASGTLTAADIVLPGTTFANIVTAIRAGTAYANIHTTAHPGGEIRDQLNAAGEGE